MKYPSYTIDKFKTKFKDGEYERMIKLLVHSHWIRYENGELDLLPKLIINQPNIFLLTVNDNCFLKPPEYYTTDTLEIIIKELMEYI